MRERGKPRNRLLTIENKLLVTRGEVGRGHFGKPIRGGILRRLWVEEREGAGQEKNPGGGPPGLGEQWWHCFGTETG